MALHRTWKQRRDVWVVALSGIGYVILVLLDDWEFRVCFLSV